MLLGNTILDVTVDLETKYRHILASGLGTSKNVIYTIIFQSRIKDMCGRMTDSFLTPPESPPAPATRTLSHRAHTPAIRLARTHWESKRLSGLICLADNLPRGVCDLVVLSNVEMISDGNFFRR